ncbi:MAG: response regulator transcription factor [Deltaproteobacteria bacterium]|nr:response regulator transcription factor [Deltaproteobacteria bacterium]
MQGLRVLVVEDDGPIADAVLYALRREGMVADVAPTLAAARRVLDAAEVVVLDLGLPDGSGFTLLPDICRHGARAIVLTSRDEDVECVAALEAGADDFVTKPFSPRALVARVRAVVRRTRAAEATVHGLLVDRERRQATWAGQDLGLTRLEFELLAVFAEAPGRVRTREQLVSRVWGAEYALAERTVDSHLKGLRRKLAEAGAPANLVETVRGVGFTLRARAP